MGIQFDIFGDGKEGKTLQKSSFYEEFSQSLSDYPVLCCRNRSRTFLTFIFKMFHLSGLPIAYFHAIKSETQLRK